MSEAGLVVCGLSSAASTGPEPLLRTLRPVACEAHLHVVGSLLLWSLLWSWNGAIPDIAGGSQASCRSLVSGGGDLPQGLARTHGERSSEMKFFSVKP